MYSWSDSYFTSISFCGVWGVGGKGQGSTLQTLHIYTFRVGLIVRMKKLENRNGEGVDKKNLVFPLCVWLREWKI